MNYTKLGPHRPRGLPHLPVGCMSYGVPARGGHPWTLDEETSRPFIKRRARAGINFFDTANVYSDGTSEEIVGRALRDFANRDEVVIATKVHGPMRRGPQRRRPVAQGDHDRDRRQPAPARHRLRRPLPDPPLGPPHADRGDDGGAARRGQGRQGPLHRRVVDVRLAVRKAQYTAERHGWTPFVTMQNHYNLLYREEEREMLPLCADQGVGVIPWSPLARGRLTRDWDERAPSGPRPTSSASSLYDTRRATGSIVERVAEVAEDRGVPRRPGRAGVDARRSRSITAPIVGATKPHHLDDAVAAVDVGSPPTRSPPRGALPPHPSPASPELDAAECVINLRTCAAHCSRSRRDEVRRGRRRVRSPATGRRRPARSGAGT